MPPKAQHDLFKLVVRRVFSSQSYLSADCVNLSAKFTTLASLLLSDFILNHHSQHLWLWGVLGPSQIDSFSSFLWCIPSHSILFIWVVSWGINDALFTSWVIFFHRASFPAALLLLVGAIKRFRFSLTFFNIWASSSSEIFFRAILITHVGHDSLCTQTFPLLYIQSVGPQLCHHLPGSGDGKTYSTWDRAGKCCFQQRIYFVHLLQPFCVFQ